MLILPHPGSRLARVGGNGQLVVPRTHNLKVSAPKECPFFVSPEGIGKEKGRLAKRKDVINYINSMIFSHTLGGRNGEDDPQDHHRYRPARRMD